MIKITSTNKLIISVNAYMNENTQKLFLFEVMRFITNDWDVLKLWPILLRMIGFFFLSIVETCKYCRPMEMFCDLSMLLRL